MMDGNGELHTCHRTFTYRGYLHPKFDSALEDEYNARLKCWARDVSSSGKEKSIIKMPISLTIQCSFILTTYKARTKPETWHHYLPPSTISKRTLSGVLGHIKYHLFPSNNIAFFCLCFYPSSQLVFSSRNCNILAVGQCAPLPRRTIHHKIRAVWMANFNILHSVGFHWMIALHNVPIIGSVRHS